MANILRRTQFGNPILRQTAQPVKVTEIRSKRVQQLIRDIRHTLEAKRYGVGLAAPQVGQSLALAIIAIKPTPTRPENKPFSLVIINPVITKHEGRKVPLWEGCISFGAPASPVFAQARRYPKITVRYYDEQAKLHNRTFSGLRAHVLQHEIDHLNGVLFVDHVKDPASFMNLSEFKKRIVKK